jgi:hypothetical protein
LAQKKIKDRLNHTGGDNEKSEIKDKKFDRNDPE